MNGSLTVIPDGYLVNKDDSTAMTMSGMVARFFALFVLFFTKLTIELLLYKCVSEIEPCMSLGHVV